ncbi:4'-phosphopantetheinyl transferase superfamily protein [Ilyomonas limi]|uniref:4'-phosphopantetheinyl transferase superfamily protein n=1 Tax=Ilyomonas limi TaxID=2575867 RepID=A0A4U3L8V2_9BACT|nr:4'-phosphopantetheinyl transferase superfamily protein [Ilyomonas limi]TKK71785.1 4'-phosphopantetheinyl transferase superfamily protein [Ilyomonas limi]
MPIFYQEDINPNTRLGIWKIEEDEHFFLQKVPFPAQVTHPNKRLQHLAGRYLLQYLFPLFPYNDILIADTRKPYLPQEQFHFSISHSGNYAAAIVSKHERVGIDIELYSPKTELIKNKFLTEGELHLVKANKVDVSKASTVINQLPPVNYQLSSQNQLFTLCWCCKEAVYKYWGAGGIDFKKHICIQHINTVKQQMDVLFTKEITQLIIHYSLFDELCLAWTVSS